jgi:lipopolysaccharide/colanic/teichoic acid biosynthesis glycosyltransferase
MESTMRPLERLTRPSEPEAVTEPAPGQGSTADVASLPSMLLVPEGSRHNTFYARRVKRWIDVVGASALIVASSPIALAAAAAVRITMGKPVLFRQERIGLDGKPFEVLKFRTMRPDRRKRNEPAPVQPDRRRTHKTANHPLLTPVGRFLRTWSIDELPQVLNVLRGEMSIVGPRPELPSVVAARYEPWEHGRHLVRPGLTGLWQITARGDGMMHDRIDLDIEYVQRVSFREDLRILVKTPSAVLGDHKGY